MALTRRKPQEKTGPKHPQAGRLSGRDLLRVAKSAYRLAADLRQNSE